MMEFKIERNELAKFDCLFFLRGDPNAEDYWSFVQYCRKINGDHNRKHAEWYDLVVGSLKKQTLVSFCDQLSFHTKPASRVLEKSEKKRVV